MGTETDVANNIIKAYKFLIREGEQISQTDSVGPTMGKERIIMLISENEGITLTKLAEKANSSKPSVLELIDKLQGLIERETIGNRLIFRLTPEGNELAKKLKSRHDEYFEKCFKNLSFIEKNQLNNLLRKMLGEISYESKMSVGAKNYQTIDYDDNLLENYGIKPSDSTSYPPPETTNSIPVGLKANALAFLGKDSSPDSNNDTHKDSTGN